MVLGISLLMTSPVISQNVTNEEDSIVCLPKSHLLKAIEEIELGDACKEELILIRENYTLITQQSYLKDSIISQYVLKDSVYQLDLNALNLVITQKDELLLLSEKRAKKYKRQKNGLIVGGGLATIAAIVLRILL